MNAPVQHARVASGDVIRAGHRAAVVLPGEGEGEETPSVEKSSSDPCRAN